MISKIKNSDTVYTEKNECRFNQNYKSCCYSSTLNIYSNWFETPYASTDYLPTPVTPQAVNWPLTFFKKVGPN